MKKISLILAMVLALSLCLAACGQSTSTATTAAAETQAAETGAETGAETEAEEVEVGDVTGGWTVNENLTNVTVPEDVVELLNKALEGYTGMGIEPVALLGTQVVSGTNYAILCKGTTVTAEPVTKLVVAILYADLNGGAEISSVTDFELEKYAGVDITVDNESLAGGWTVYDQVPNIALEEDAQAAFDGAVGEVVGAGYNQIATLGTQVVAGTNFAILALKTTVTAEPVSQMCVVTVYAGVDGTNELISVADINIADFNQ